MTRYQVDSDEVVNTEMAARAALERIQAEAAGLTSILASLQASWEGQASAAFQSVVSDWSATQQRVGESAEAINQALSAAGRRYAEVEAYNAQLFAA